MVSRKPSGKVPSGSPSTGEPEYLVVGTLRRPHGVHGAMVMQVITDFPERLIPGTQLFLGDAHTPVALLSTRVHNRGLVVKLIGVDTPEEAGNLRNQLVYVRAADRPRLPTGEFYHHQLIGLHVVNEADQPIGILSEILQTRANDVYVVRRANGSEVLLPVIPTVILAIETDRRLIRVRAIPGLLEES
jgi:16S rRNA processing protein RimM